MSYQEIYAKDNARARERLELVCARIREAAQGPETQERYADYFQKTAEFILLTAEVLKMQQEGALWNRSMEECETWNQRLYADILPGEAGYDRSYANPAYAVKKLGEALGGPLCFLYAECRALIAYAFEGRIADMAVLMELFVEIYTCFCSKEGTDADEIRGILYWHFHDYSELIVAQSIRESVDPKLDFYRNRAACGFG